MIITITNTKGGVGKTTLCANLSGYLADHGKRVLAVDTDVQPTLSSYYPIIRKAPNGLNHLITKADITDVVSTTGIPGMDLIYSDDPGGTLQSFILHAPDGRQRLAWTLDELKPVYDVILIDTQGAVGPLQESAIFADDIVLSLCIESIAGLEVRRPVRWKSCRPWCRSSCRGVSEPRDSRRNSTMAKKENDTDNVVKLLKAGHFGEEPEIPASVDLLMETPLVLTLDQLVEYDRNTRNAPNSEYETLKASYIKTGAANTLLVVTKRPGEEFYFPAAGGNTRLRVLRELWDEFHDERYYRVHCKFISYENETKIQIAHRRR